ncbi:DUF2207 domain-containing protein, partial [Candidatus Saccharibacteria bacterium]|nr:DUF2207 domain-containing protein [Candidatus Saccharibacteria bacterium]
MLGKCRLIVGLFGLAIVASIFMSFATAQPVAAADVNDFYFSSMHTDFYLWRETDGLSKMQVKETLVARFPDFNQNKGIERAIPLANQDGANVVLTDTNVVVTRNEQAEPIWSTERTRDYYLVATGTDDYLRGQQTYGFEYMLDRVITDFTDHQELYWDVNGTDWKQRFDEVSATIHFDAATAAAFTGETACYIGKYGSDEKNCTIAVAADGSSVTVTAGRALQPSENLSFVLGFQPGAFVVPEPETIYWVFIVGMISIGLTILLVVLAIVQHYRQIYLPQKQHQRPIVPEY